MARSEIVAAKGEKLRKSSPSERSNVKSRRKKKSTEGAHLVLFYATTRVSRAFQSLARSDGISLTRFDLALFARSDFDPSHDFDAIVVEQPHETSSEPNLVRWLGKVLPEVPLVAYGMPAESVHRSRFSLHLTEVPSARGIHSLLADARRHHKTAKKASHATHRLRETSRRLQVLGDIVSTANSSLEPSRVVAVIMSQIQQLIPSEAWSILLVDEDKKELTFEMALGEKGEDFGDIRLKIGEGIAGWVAKTSKPVIVNDVSRDPRFMRRFDEQTQFQTRSVLCAPLVSRGNTIGVVEVMNREARSRFTKRDLKLLLTMVEPAAIALENALLFQRAERLAVTDDLTKL